MKILNPVLLAVVLLVFACKKERTCRCGITRTGVINTTNKSAGFPPLIAPTETTTTEAYTYKTTSTEVFGKVSKNDMRAACPARSEEGIFDRSSVSASGVFTTTTVDSGTRIRECVIE